MRGVGCDVCLTSTAAAPLPDQFVQCQASRSCRGPLPCQVLCLFVPDQDPNCWSRSFTDEPVRECACSQGLTTCLICPCDPRFQQSHHFRHPGPSGRTGAREAGPWKGSPCVRILPGIGNRCSLGFAATQCCHARSCKTAAPTRPRGACQPPVGLQVTSTLGRPRFQDLTWGPSGVAAAPGLQALSLPAVPADAAFPPFFGTAGDTHPTS